MARKEVISGIASPLNNQLRGTSARPNKITIHAGSGSINPPTPTISRISNSVNHLKQLFVEDYQESTDGSLLREKVQPYFKNIFADIALRSHTPK